MNITFFSDCLEYTDSTLIISLYSGEYVLELELLGQISFDETGKYTTINIPDYLLYMIRLIG